MNRSPEYGLNSSSNLPTCIPLSLEYYIDVYIIYIYIQCTCFWLSAFVLQLQLFLQTSEYIKKLTTQIVYNTFKNFFNICRTTQIILPTVLVRKQFSLNACQYTLSNLFLLTTSNHKHHRISHQQLFMFIPIIYIKTQLTKRWAVRSAFHKIYCKTNYFF